MLGNRRTIPFWRPKKRLLAQERALTTDRPVGGQAAAREHALAESRTKGRMATESRKKARFSEQ